MEYDTWGKEKYMQVTKQNFLQVLLFKDKESEDQGI